MINPCYLFSNNDENTKTENMGAESEYLSNQELSAAIWEIANNKKKWPKLVTLANSACYKYGLTKSAGINGIELIGIVIDKSLKPGRNETRCKRNLDVMAFIITNLESKAVEEIRISKKYIERFKSEEPPESIYSFETNILETDLKIDTLDSTLENDLKTDIFIGKFEQFINSLNKDPVAQLVMDGRMMGLKGKELLEYAGNIDVKTLATKNKLIRRRMQEYFPEGTKI